MLIRVCRRIILVCGLIALPGFHLHVCSQSARSTLPKSHRHLRIGNSVAADIPEFSMSETSLESGAIKENLRTNSINEYDAFTIDVTRLFVAERKTGKIFEIRGLPLEWRPFSNLIWADNRTLMFDRWSQPHYGVHYAVDVERRKLIAALPFPDKFYLEAQRPKRRSDRGR